MGGDAVEVGDVKNIEVVGRHRECVVVPGAVQGVPAANTAASPHSSAGPERAPVGRVCTQLHHLNNTSENMTEYHTVSTNLFMK